jgi:serine/threonine-protein kinase
MVGEPKPGDVLRGKYRVERMLGSGGMGTVLLATHLKMGQLVAVKMLLPEARKSSDVMLRFSREARAASKLKSEHAVRILDVDESEEGEPFLVMEYLEGKDLHAVVEMDGPLPVEEAIGYVLQACEGIAEAHAAGIIHRDLKPANLFLTKRADGTPLVKILDFGISKAVDADSPGTELVTMPQSVMGSPSYMSPEQLRNASAVDSRTDIWALGVVLHQLLAGALPFAATGIAALAARIAADPPTQVRALRADVPADLERVILKCLEKDVDARFGDIPELARALAPFAPAGSAGALRVARTAETRRAAEEGEQTVPAAASSSPRAASIDVGPAAGLATASLHDVAPKSDPLAGALATEYAATVGQEPVTARDPKRRSLAVLALATAIAVIVAGAIGFKIMHVPTVDAPAQQASAPPPAPQAPSSLVADKSSFEPVVPPSASSSSAAPTIASAPSRLDAAAGTAPKRPLATQPAETTPSKPKNPMELDFK